MNGQIVFIIWRESVEALLVVGILHGWLSHAPGGAGGLRYLWGGVAAGLALAAALGLGMMRLAQSLGDEAQERLMAGAMFLAVALILQMVIWMRRHGRSLRHDLERGLDAALTVGRLWGIFALALIAVAREGSETVIFLAGTLAAAGPIRFNGTLLSVASGFAAALTCYALLQAGSRWLRWSTFFRISELMLLLLGCALLVTGAGHLVSLGLLPYGDPVWDSSWLLDDMGALGGLVASLTGYRAMPDTVTLATWIGYALLVTLLLRPWRRAGRLAGPA
ncbi:FTR1 family iron permease [Cereibacter changlensis JA139]|uniref:FTR1 family iron permease n=2 Tax=Cereibacter changlensis TaxID=402884 RepID=A0A2T4JPB0_9RHOB|nr:FTR1 family protein [Cereibacter changlensis]PTE19731.1 FTR1 family iron permease [Cereibacter changlensis JA139]PZX50035.1 high-affinity iron transporter [Cereibacter changlensis]